MLFFTGNKGKFEEFKQVLHDIEQPEDFISVPEIECQIPEEVILHKAKDMYKENKANEPILVEDTALFIEEAEVGTNIKYLQSELKNLTGKRAEWVVMLAKCDGKTVKVYKGIVEGKIVEPKGISNFGFDRYFKPSNSDKTLAELFDSGEKDIFSARIKAAEKLIKNKEDISIEMDKIRPWSGEYQEE